MCSHKNILNRSKSNTEKGILVVQAGKAGKKLSDGLRQAGLRCLPPPLPPGLAWHLQQGAFRLGQEEDVRAFLLSCCHMLEELKRNPGYCDTAVTSQEKR